MAKIPKDKNKKKIINLIIIFIILFFICGCKLNFFKKIFNTILGRSETFVNQLGGAGRYHKLTDSDTLESVINKHSGNECSIVVVGADWCGYTKQLYNSGELQEAAKTHLVVVVDEKHSEAQRIMKEVDSQGFPTIALHCKKRGLGKYNGPRTSASITRACVCSDNQVSSDSKGVINVSDNEDPEKKAKVICRETGKGVLICILAPWCGHCKRLKESGELEKLSRTHSVVIASDENEHASKVMNKYKSRGFPTLLVMHQSGKVQPYNGDRIASEIKKSL